MTKYSQDKLEAFADIPIEFQRFADYLGYECGHHAGEDECDLIAMEVAHDLKPLIDAYNARIGNQTMKLIFIITAGILIAYAIGFYTGMTYQQLKPQ